MKLPLQKYVAEFIGTFALAGVVTLSVIYALPFTPLIAALTLGVGVFVLGPICGAHFNPAITVGFWSVGKITTRDGIAYIVAQLLAGLVAYVCMPMLAQDVLITAAEGDWLTGLAEAVGAFFLAMGVASVVYGKVKESAGFAVGGSLLVGIFFASTLSDGILNPAVALASGAWSLAYAAGPVLGALIGVWAYRWMAGAK